MQFLHLMIKKFCFLLIEVGKAHIKRKRNKKPITLCFNAGTTVCLTSSCLLARKFVYNRHTILNQCHSCLSSLTCSSTSNNTEKKKEDTTKIVAVKCWSDCWKTNPEYFVCTWESRRKMWSLSFTNVPRATREQSDSNGSCVSCRWKTHGPFCLAQSHDHHQGSDVASTFQAGGPSRLALCAWWPSLWGELFVGWQLGESVHT